MNVASSRPPQWTTSLTGSCDDGVLCCITCVLPCITFGQIAEVLDEGHTSCLVHGFIYGLLWTMGCHCLHSCTYRGRLREKYNLPEEPCNDFCVHWCCDACALCQEYAELKNRGIDASQGWKGPPNVPHPVPPMPPSMYR
ncbi:hypothetical protein AMTRI_Chr07g24720 [Amborella trichopoda]|uniref:Uncharacterized protein n=1 Tax=Amborella trichopoda TaxID=13333 RepID=U5CZS5_AMBTC|nr:protein PLANT CADMIUM RESISTANCE 7 [Amborella trichopoda]ERN18866.1 hypothetical protein AMTR_s00067p00142050 [Amborella trichopoda]|eukprot:XP_006857399.1 protein PLANT CADMIUM RESISTANCE 7 [Amborella trichopoda]